MRKAAVLSILFAAVLLAVAVIAAAQQPKKVPRIGYFQAPPPSAVADYVDLYRRAAVYVDKILRGAKPADLPVQQATKFEFIINLKAAKQIGLTIPVRVLERANEVIK